MNFVDVRLLVGIDTHNDLATHFESPKEVLLVLERRTVGKKKLQVCRGDHGLRQMIRNGTIIYTASDSPWEPSEGILSAAAIGLFTTLLSYQSFSVLHTLFLGGRRRHTASPAAMHIHLLLRKCSPLAVLSALTRSDTFTRLYHFKALSPNSSIARDHGRIQPFVVIKLIVLLIAAPLLNMAALVMTLENEKVLTFREAGFGGIALSPVPNSSAIRTHRLTQFCEAPEIDWKGGDFPVMQLSLCDGPWVSKKYVVPMGRVSIVQVGEIQFVIEVQIGYTKVMSGRFAVVHTKGVKLDLQAIAPKASVDRIVDIGLEKVVRECAVTRVIFLNFSEPVQGKVLGSKSIACYDIGDSRRKAVHILRQLKQHFTIVEAEQLNLAQGSGQLFDGSDIECLRRRRKNVAFVPLVWLAVGTLLFRLLLAVVWRGNIEEGIERVIKEQLGYSCCSSLLYEDGEVISFGKKYQGGNIAQYGLERSDLPAVERFNGGVVGACREVERADGVT